MTGQQETHDTGSQGFSLIELLVAMVLLALMFLLLSSGLRFGTKIWSEHGNELSEASHILVVENLLRRLLSEARPVVVKATADRPQHVNFEGTRDSIRFVAPMLEHLGGGGLYEVTIKVSRIAKSRNKIEMSWRVFPQSTKDHQSILLEGPVDLEFSFLGDSETDQTAQWYNDWHFRQHLPKLIETRLTVHGRRWPKAVIALNVRSNQLRQPSEAF